jgi:hypothetical protein
LHVPHTVFAGWLGRYVVRLDEDLERTVECFRQALAA